MISRLRLVLLDFFGYYTSVVLSLSRLLSEYLVASECRRCLVELDCCLCGWTNGRLLGSSGPQLTKSWENT
jgi:hypothetical protein